MRKPISPIERQPRYKQLDGLRGVAAVTVFFGHYMSIKIHEPLYSTLYPTPIAVLFNGNAAVMFFFVLSGFVLSLPFIDNKKPLSLAEFYLKRFFRIFPAFIFAIIFSVVLKEFVFDKNGMLSFSEWIKASWMWGWNKESVKEILKTFLLIGPHFNENFIDQTIWSLIIEMKMSIILPFFIIIAARGGVVFNVIFLFVITSLSYDHQYWALPIFYLGVLSAKYKWQIISEIRKLNLIYVFAAFLVAIFLYNNAWELSHFHMQIKSPDKITCSNYFVAIGSGIIMFIVMAREKLSRILESSFFTFLGNISYSFYLIHFPLLLTMASLFSARFSYSLFYIFSLTIIAAFVVGYLMFIFIERPFQRFAARLVGKYKILSALKIGTKEALST